jgi:hypothetical protein
VLFIVWPFFGATSLFQRRFPYLFKLTPLRFHDHLTSLIFTNASLFIPYRIMHRKLQLCLASLLVSIAALPSAAIPNFLSRQKRAASKNFDTNPNGSSFLWVIQDTYAGSTFFEWVASGFKWENINSSNPSGFDFFTGDDPTQYVPPFIVLAMPVLITLLQWFSQLCHCRSSLAA